MTADAKLLADRLAQRQTGVPLHIAELMIGITEAERELILQALRGQLYVPEPRWRPHTEKPTETEPVSCVIAFHDRDGDDEPFEAVLCSGIYLWRLGKFVHEDDGSKAKEPFFWTYEREITASVPAASPCESQSAK